MHEIPFDLVARISPTRIPLYGLIAAVLVTFFSKSRLNTVHRASEQPLELYSPYLLFLTVPTPLNFLLIFLSSLRENLIDDEIQEECFEREYFVSIRYTNVLNYRKKGHKKVERKFFCEAAFVVDTLFRTNTFKKIRKRKEETSVCFFRSKG